MHYDTSKQISPEGITERGLHEDARLVSKALHRNLFNSISAGCAYCRMIFEKDRPVDFIHEVVNQQFKNMIGIDKLEGLKISEVIEGFNTSNPELFEKLVRATQSGAAERFKYYISLLDKWFDISIYSQSKEDFVLVLNPINAVNTGICVWNPDDGKMVWSDELLMLFGIDQLANETSYDVWLKSILPSDRGHTDKAIQSAVAKGVKFCVVCRISCRDGIIRRLMHQGFPVKRTESIENRYIISCSDITEYENKNITCPHNKINLDMLLSSSIDPCCFLALDGTICDTNQYFNDLYAKADEILIGQNFHKRYPCKLQKERKSRFDRVFYTGESISYMDSCFGPKKTITDCADCLYQISVYPVYGRYNEIKYLAVIILNSNKLNKKEQAQKEQAQKEQAQKEQAQKELDRKYKTLIAASPDSIITTNLQGIITSISDMGIGIFGANDSSEFIGIPLIDLVHSSDINGFKKVIEVAFSDGLIQNREILLRKKNKTIYSAEISAALIQDYDGMPLSYMIIIRDISQRKVIESELFHAKRLISLGEMASGIAHEIYQPINNIGLIVDRLIMDAEANKWSCKEVIKTRSEKIFDNILRVQTIIDNIRSFSSVDNNYISSVVNVNKSIENTRLMFFEQCKHKSILLNFKAPQSTLFVVGNPYKYEQVVYNLITNSIDALEEKKQFSDSGFEMKILLELSCNQDKVIFSIEDNGIGIPPETIEYIMHPFYTTKNSGKGTGLGLSISYRIIKEMNGDIKVKSTLMKGTEVIITFPIKKSSL